MKKINKFLVSFLTIFVFSAMTVMAVTLLRPSGGGTGTGVAPAKGSLLVGATSTSYGVVAIGTNGKVLTASSTAINGVSWEPVSGGGSTTTINNVIGPTFTISIVTTSSQSSITTTTAQLFLNLLKTTSGTNISVGTDGTVNFVNPGFVTAASATTWTADQTFKNIIFQNATGTSATSSISVASGTIGVLQVQGALGVSSTIASTGAITGSSTITAQTGLTVNAGGITQSGGVNSISSTTVTGNATTTNLTVTGVTSALHLGSAAGVVSGYAGSSCTTGSLVTSVSATGVVSCNTTSSILSGYSTSTGANPTATIGTTAVNGSANTFMRSDAAPAIAAGLLPTIATTTKTIYDINATSTDYPSFVINIPAAATITRVDCYNDNVAGNTFTFNIVASTTITTGLTYASTSLLFGANQTCTATSTNSALTSFANAAISAGQSVWLWITSASTTAAHVQIDY